MCTVKPPREGAEMRVRIHAKEIWIPQKYSDPSHAVSLYQKHVKSYWETNQLTRWVFTKASVHIYTVYIYIYVSLKGRREKFAGQILAGKFTGICS